MARGAPVRALVSLLPALLAFSGAGSARADVALEPVVEGLGFASNVAFAPDGTVFVNEKDRGEIRVVRDGRMLDEPFVTLPVQVTANETGLLGVAVHPGFPDEPWVYAYYSDAETGRNRVVRIRAEDDVGTELQPVLDLLPFVSGYHNGGDIAFGPDGKLYVATGEAHEPGRAQDPNDLGGKILRLDPGGSIPADNPFGPDDPVYALGIRNSFGICFDPVRGDLWETENGPDRFDEVNRIEAGRNYGWPEQLGPGGEPAFGDPVLAFETVIVPTGCAVTEEGSALYFGTYGGQLRLLALPARGNASDRVVADVPGGIVDVARAPDGSIWVTATDAIYRFETPTAASASPSAPPSASPTVGQNGSATPAPTPSPAAGSAGLTPAAIVVGLVLIGGLLLFRSRMLRR